MADDNRVTIKIPRDDWKRHNERRKTAELSWPEYIDGTAPELKVNEGLTADEVRSIVKDEIEDALSRITANGAN